ncbi:MAG: cytochrome c3 family protein [Nitrospirae bacterium]|nr:cytochrome c3 family protein [Nitrospirota bacterium]
MNKKLIILLLTLAMGLVIVSGAMPYTGSYAPGIGINGTVHDLGTSHNGMNYTASPADSLNRICIFCHAPHNTYRLSTATGGAGPQAPADFDYLPLWNHSLQADLAYQMYENGPGAPQSGSKASQAILYGMVPGSTSLLCLSCHDGSVAVNSYGNVAQRPGSMSTGSSMITSAYVIGQDKYLGNHHPIGFNFSDVRTGDTEIRNPAVAMLNVGETVNDHLYGGKMECGTCHSVHNKGNTGEALLWRSDQNSELCLTCHDKGTYTAP